MQVEKPLELVQCHHKVLPESLCHKVRQLQGGGVAQRPACPVGLTKAGGAGASPEVTVDRTIRGDAGGGGGVHRFFLVHRRFVFYMPSGVQVLLQRRPVLLSTFLSRLQTLFAADVDRLWSEEERGGATHINQLSGT